MDCTREEEGAGGGKEGGGGGGREASEVVWLLRSLRRDLLLLLKFITLLCSSDFCSANSRSVAVFSWRWRDGGSKREGE